jgi:hypothetical protein
MSTTSGPATSKGENVPEIQLLTQRILELNQATDWWNAAMIWALVFVALSAIAVVGTTVMALRRAKQVGDAQSELIRVKDNQLTIELRAKDVNIADAQKAAGEANERAGAAIERASKADERASKNEKDAAELRKVAEGERLARVKIEENLAGWKLSSAAQERLRQKLKPFSGTHFDLVANPVETSFMETLDGLLTSSTVGWIRQVPKNADGTPAVILLANKAAIFFASGITVDIAQDAVNTFGGAVAAFADGLTAEGIPVKAHYVSQQGFDPTAIHIGIGKRE